MRRRAAIGLFVVLCLGAAVLLTNPWRHERRLARMSESELRAWTARRPDDARAHLHLALRRGRRGDTRDASAHLMQALDLDPDLIEARWRLARVLAATGDEDGAEALLARGLQRDPRAWRLHAERARIHDERRDSRSAALTWHEVTSLAPDNADAWYRLGRARLALNDDAGALDAFRRAVALSPRSAAYQTALAGALRLRRAYDEAERHCALALQAAPADLDANFTLARILHDRDGATAATQEALRHCVMLAPENPLPRYALASAYQQRGELPAALAEYRTTLRLLEARRPPPDADWPQRDAWLSQVIGPHLNLAKLLQRMERPREAARHLAAFHRYANERNRRNAALIRGLPTTHDNEFRPTTNDPESGPVGPKPPNRPVDPSPRRPVTPFDPSVPRFEDVAATAGIHFQQGQARKRPLTILEATGSGCAFLDVDDDGWLDLLLVGQPRCALYRNRGDGTFADVTRAAGLDSAGFWIGCATGDIDNDGDVDLFVTGYNVCALYRNQKRRAESREPRAPFFQDITATSGIQWRGFQTSAAFGDVDRDGLLDLYICRYVRFGPRAPQYCPASSSSLLRTCGPDHYDAEIGLFYHNRGGGLFVEATKAFGFASAHGKAWGAAFTDYDRDGWPDLYVANDEMPGDLFHNTGRGRVENVGLASGTAYNADGFLQGGMGADWGDANNDGRPDLVVTTFWMEPNALYQNDGRGLFSEVSYATGVGQATRKKVGFGARFLDVDNDGWLDLFFVNGHVQDTSAIDPEQGMPQLMQLFRNDGAGRFHDLSALAGEPFRRPIVGRGAAFGDYDNDGRVDAAVIDMEGRALLLRNHGADPPHQGHWLTVRALAAPLGRLHSPLPASGRGAGGERLFPPSPRDAIGAQVTLFAGTKKLMREVQTSGSVLSANDPRVHFGLGEATRVNRISIRWPDGTTESFPGVPADRIVTIRQGDGE
jgi:tetratricopeptide (TPR) repeat protein